MARELKERVNCIGAFRSGAQLPGRLPHTSVSEVQRMRCSLRLSRLAAVGVIAVVAASASARAESVLRIAMTAGDIPSWTGQPDQGFEGYRFVGYALYDGLTNWDLSRGDKEVDIRPGLATKW